MFCLEWTFSRNQRRILQPISVRFILEMQDINVCGISFNLQCLWHFERRQRDYLNSPNAELMSIFLLLCFLFCLANNCSRTINFSYSVAITQISIMWKISEFYFQTFKRVFSVGGCILWDEKILLLKKLFFLSSSVTLRSECLVGHRLCLSGWLTQLRSSKIYSRKLQQNKLLKYNPFFIFICMTWFI